MHSRTRKLKEDGTWAARKLKEDGTWAAIWVILASPLTRLQWARPLRSILLPLSLRLPAREKVKGHGWERGNSVNTVVFFCDLSSRAGSWWWAGEGRADSSIQDSHFSAPCLGLTEALFLRFFINHKSNWDHTLKWTAELTEQLA